MSNFRMMRKFWQYEWMNILFVMYTLKIQVIQTVNIRHKKQSYEIWSIKKLDMSMARRHFKTPQSLYGTSTHPTMVTHRSQSWSWMIDSHPFRSMSITHPHPIPQISLFQTLTLKLQGQGHGWGQRWRSHSSPSIQPMHLFFLSHQSDQPFLRYVQ